MASDAEALCERWISGTPSRRLGGPRAHLMAQNGMATERYSDDFVIHCATREEAERALILVQEWTVQAALTLPPSKTRLMDLGQPGAHLDFLGDRLQRHINRMGAA